MISSSHFFAFAQVIHGDLKPENILIRHHDGRAKLIDFGFSHIVKPGEHLEVVSASFVRVVVTFLFLPVYQVIGGTIAYSPPFDEMMTFAFDDWSCGVILYAMLTCTLPFSTRVLESKAKLTLSIPESISDGISLSLHST